MPPLYLMCVKPSSENQHPNDTSQIIATVPPEQAYLGSSEGGCPFVGASSK
jgi:hypothetical protein